MVIASPAEGGPFLCRTGPLQREPCDRSYSSPSRILVAILNASASASVISERNIECDVPFLARHPHINVWVMGEDWQVGESHENVTLLYGNAGRAGRANRAKRIPANRGLKMNLCDWVSVTRRAISGTSDGLDSSPRCRAGRCAMRTVAGQRRSGSRGVQIGQRAAGSFERAGRPVSPDSDRHAPRGRAHLERLPVRSVLVVGRNLASRGSPTRPRLPASSSKE